jgi:tetratricopeptide (TPR) repeat protein
MIQRGWFFFLFIITLNLFVSAQTQQEQSLAMEYLTKGEYEKAIRFYEKFHNYEPANLEFYKNYLVCLMELKDFKSAEKLIRKQIRDFKDKLTYSVDLGVFYKKTGEDKKAKQTFDELLKNIGPPLEKLDELAQLFLLAGENQYALQTYQKALKVVGDFPAIRMKLAEVYGIMGDNQQMINELMAILQKDESQISSVQNVLVTLLDDNPESELNLLVKNTLLREVQKNPSNIAYAEMLIWLFIQHRNFDAAFTQSKALDKRINGQGDDLMQLGQICMENRKYDVAVKCYEYVISKGSESYNYISARIELLRVLNTKLMEDYHLNKDELLNLEANYEATLREIGNSQQAASLKIELAHLQAFYLDKSGDAKKLLQEMLERKQGKAEDLARAKMKLADILVLEGDMWEPSLLYGQVEKEFKNDVLGQEAKFRNAKLSFYRGEFTWAEAQMKVLKASTSKLIANDALALSLLIMDNSGLDTSFTALEIYSRADLLTYQNKLEKADKTLDTLISMFTYHPILDEVYFKKAEIALKKADYTLALQHYETILKNYPTDILADDALFRMGDIYERKLDDIAKAMECYQRIMLEYSGSMYVIEARKRYRQLRGDKVN